MGIGKSSWKEAKEKAKAAGKKIRQKEVGTSIKNYITNDLLDREASYSMLANRKSPANGNAFGLAMQKAGGDYDKAKAMMDSSPVNYGSGSPFKLMKSKIFNK